MIPELKQAAVKNALQTAFGVSEFESIQQLTQGLSSALIFRITIKSRSYLLRVIMRDDAMADPARYYASMRTAAEAGIGPRVWYTGETDRISITDFIEAKPFSIQEARLKLPALARQLHALPPFAFRINYLDVMDGIVQKFKAGNFLPGSMMGDVFEQYERIKAIYPRNTEDMVGCHNDVKPDNIIYDGERPWFVDWEAAFLNDRYLDLAIIGNFVVTNMDDEKEYLQLYFNGGANEYRHARYFLMCQLLHMFYAAFLLATTPGISPVDENMQLPTFRELHDDLWIAKVSMADVEPKKIYALVHLKQLQHNLQLKRFEDSLKIISKGLL